MRADLLARIRRPMRALAIATFLGLALGYSVFYFVFPNVSVPASDEASLPLILGILLLAAVLGGLLTEDLPSSVIQAFVSIPIGAVIAFSLAISPVAIGFLQVQMDDIFSFVVRLPLPLYLLAVPLYLIFGVIGLLIRERFGFRSSEFLRRSGDRNRK